MKHSNISIFVPHAGCPFQCAFCNQHTITSQQKLPRAEDVNRICSQAMQEISDKSQSEIAFFGGSFTAIPEQYMLELLKSAQPFIGEGKFHGIRISTRPDCITPEILETLKKYHVTAIELGAQSMSDKVLQANQRGHSAKDVFASSALIRKYGFELGLQVMKGLYQSTLVDENITREAVCEIHPDTVRIYPVVILKGTKLAELYQSGEYDLMPFQDMVELVASDMRIYMEEEDIQIIKVGLHASEFVEADQIGGYYHPAFRELCESEIYQLRMETAVMILGWKLHGLRRQTVYAEDRVFAVHPSCISKAVGQKKANIRYFYENYGIRVKVVGDDEVQPFQVKIIS
ncbi:MAG: radical SAM protein [Oscillospiraceae bacterium]